MFGRGKLPPKTHGQQVRDELGESLSHLKLAAAHVAGGTAEKLTPAYDRTRRLASKSVAPLLSQIKEGATHARSSKPESRMKKRKPLLIGLAAAGTVAGAAGVVIARKRKAASQWDEYQPPSPLSTAKEKVSAAADKISDSASKLVHSSSSGESSHHPSPFSQFNEDADEFSGSRNGRV